MAQRVGVIGLGIMGSSVTQVLHRNPLVELTAFCTLDEEKLRKAQAEYSVSAGHADYREMLEKESLDMVYNRHAGTGPTATPSSRVWRPAVTCTWKNR